MHSLCCSLVIILYYYLFILLFIIRACFMLLFFFSIAALIAALISALISAILYAFFMHPLGPALYASTMHPNVHQRFSVRFLFFFVPYSFSLLYPLHVPQKLISTERPFLGRYRPNFGCLVV